MRISDWSSDVCSSDLLALRQVGAHAAAIDARPQHRPGEHQRAVGLRIDPGGFGPRAQLLAQAGDKAVPFGDRTSVGWGKRGSVRVDLGGRRIINKKTIKDVRSHKS